MLGRGGGVSGDSGDADGMWQGEKGMRIGEDERGEPEFFEGNGNLYAIGSLGCVEIDIGGFVG